MSIFRGIGISGLEGRIQIQLFNIHLTAQLCASLIKRRAELFNLPESVLRRRPSAGRAIK